MAWKTIKTRRICAGEYETVNTSEKFAISKSMDGDGTWNVSSNDYDGNNTGLYSIWTSKKECIDYLESIHNDFNAETHPNWFEVE